MGPEVTWFGGVTGTGSDFTGTGRDVTRSDIMATGSHVVWGGTPRTRQEKGARAQIRQREDRTDMTSPLVRVGTADPRQGKLRAPIRQKKTPCWKKSHFLNSF